MKSTHYILSFLSIGLFLASCGNEPKSTEDNKESATQKTVVVDSQTVVKFSLLPETVEVKWIGYKLAEKVGVNGAFKEFTLTGYNNESSSIKDLMTGTEISIKVGSTKTGDEVRDGKIITSFFGSMNATETINAKLVSLSGETSGIAKVLIKMNDVEIEKELDWSYTKDNFTFLLNGTIEVPEWNAQSALDALNLVCEEKHRGEGAVAVTWSDVAVSAFVLIDEK